MKKEMLINVLQPEECRIAILEDGILEELYVERTSHESYVGNIYKGRIVNIEPSIQAAFVDFGVGRNGFLHVSDVEPAYYRHLEQGRGDNNNRRGGGRNSGGRGRSRNRGVSRPGIGIPPPPREVQPDPEDIMVDVDNEADEPLEDFGVTPDLGSPNDISVVNENFAADADDWLSPEGMASISEDLEAEEAEVIEEDDSDEEFSSGESDFETDSENNLSDASPKDKGALNIFDEPEAKSPYTGFGAGLLDNELDQSEPEESYEDEEDFAEDDVEDFDEENTFADELDDSNADSELEAPSEEDWESTLPAFYRRELQPIPTDLDEDEEDEDSEPEEDFSEPEEDLAEPEEGDSEPEEDLAEPDELTDSLEEEYSEPEDLFPEKPTESPRPMDSAESRTQEEISDADLTFGSEPVFKDEIVQSKPKRSAAEDSEETSISIKTTYHETSSDENGENAGFSDADLSFSLGSTKEEAGGKGFRPESPNSTEEEPEEAVQDVEEEPVEVTAIEEEEVFEIPPRKKPSKGDSGGYRFQQDFDEPHQPRQRDRGKGYRRGGRRPMNRRPGRPGAGRPKPLIQDIFKRGQEVLVQVIKEGIGTKGPTLSTYISIAGRYLVLMPGLNRIGVSRKITDEDKRRRLRDILSELKPPRGLGFIIRTAGLDRTKKELQRDLAYLSRLWQVVVRRIRKLKSPTEIYQESDMITRTIRDTFTSEIERIYVDEEKAFEHAQEFLQIVMPRYSNRINRYAGSEPIFHKYGIEDEIGKIHKRHVPLPNGGSIVIDQTEALVAIDVNSGNFRADNNAEETAYQMNLLAAREIARQLRLRDLGGVIVNDFIDMREEKHRRGVEHALREAVRRDRARTKILKISAFGIIEMTRQRIRPSLKRSVYQDCAHCNGSGQIKTCESMSIDVMRMLQLACTQGGITQIHVEVQEEVSIYLNNRKRREVSALEEKHQTQIHITGVICAPPEHLEFVCYDNNNNEIRFPAYEEPTLPRKIANTR